MRWLVLAPALVMSACAHQNAADEAMLEKQRLQAQSDAVFANVEEHAACAGFHRAHAELDPDRKSKAAFHTTAARNAEITAPKSLGLRYQKTWRKRWSTNSLKHTRPNGPTPSTRIPIKRRWRQKPRNAKSWLKNTSPSSAISSRPNTASRNRSDHSLGRCHWLASHLTAKWTDLDRVIRAGP